MARDPSPRMFALRGDLEKSRDVRDREGLGAQLRAAFRAAGSFGSGSGAPRRWRVPLEMTAGVDEVTALTEDPTLAFDYAVGVNLGIWPHRFRWALSRGEVDFGLRERSTTKMDGSVFHRSREAIQRARREGVGFVVELGRATPQPSERLAEASASVYLRMMAGWTARQAEVVRLAHELDTQEEMATRLGVTQGAISQHLKAVDYDALTRIEDAMRTWLASLAEE